MIGIVVSRADEASAHIGERLLDIAEWTAREDHARPDAEGGGTYYTGEGFELREFDGLHLHLEGAAEPFCDPDLLVFVSRHAGETGPLLTAHFTGNFASAEFGGAAGELARACPNAHARVLQALEDRAPDGYDVGMECTHHGPSDLDAPSMFVELGSGEEQWRDPAAAKAVAGAVLDIEGAGADRERVVVGFGGGHYAPRFARIARETDWAVGHVAADWALAEMGEIEDDVLRQAFERSGATRAVIDGDRPDLADAIEGLGYRVVSETWVRETVGVALDYVTRIEDALCPIDDGLRLGEAAARTGSFEVRAPDPDLLADVHGIDPERARETVAEHAVAFETEESGSRVAGRVAATPDGYDALIDAFVALLEERYDDVRRTEGGVEVRETAFDPGKAREHGVPEGPAFGRLSRGESVEVEGETVTPEMVHTERRRRYSL